METLKAAEYQAEAQAWRRHEPALARHAEHYHGLRRFSEVSTVAVAGKRSKTA